MDTFKSSRAKSSKNKERKFRKKSTIMHVVILFTEAGKRQGRPKLSTRDWCKNVGISKRPGLENPEVLRIIRKNDQKSGLRMNHFKSTTFLLDPFNF